MRAVRSCITFFGFAAIFVSLTLVSAVITSAVRGQF
jgi:hypothetical protein